MYLLLLEAFGVSLDTGGWLWAIIALGAMIAVIGLFLFVYFQTIHPKVTFKVYSRTGVHTKMYRLYYGKYPTDQDIFALLLGKRPVGFPIKWFKYDYFDGKFCYVAQFIDGRLFPLPIRPMLGMAQVQMKVCTSCKKSDKTLDVSLHACPDCKGKLEYQTLTLEATYLQEMKYDPEIETRALYSTEIDQKGNRVPLSEWLIMYDIGAKIAEAMDKSDDETRHVLEQNNPFIAAILASAPLAIIMIAFGFASYIMWQGMGSNMSEIVRTMADITRMLKEIKGV